METSNIQNQKQNVDEQQVRELVLWFENTEVLYNRRNEWIKNYNRKIKRGVFDETLAIKGIVNLVEQVRYSYVAYGKDKQFNDFGRVNAATKLEAAKQIYESSIKEDLA